MANNETKKWEENPNELGALWERTSQAGKKYFWGKLKIDGKEIIITVNATNKSSDKSPDWRVFRKDDQAVQPAAKTTTTAKSAPKAVSKPVSKAAPVAAQSDNDFEAVL